MIIWPNWVHEITEKKRLKSIGELMEWVEVLRRFQSAHHCILFPPIDYAMLFARKELWISEAQRMLRFVDAQVVPSLICFEEEGLQRNARARRCVIKEFAVSQGVSRLVVKRSISECSKHVWTNVCLQGSKVSKMLFLFLCGKSVSSENTFF